VTYTGDQADDRTVQKIETASARPRQQARRHAARCGNARILPPMRTRPAHSSSDFDRVGGSLASTLLRPALGCRRDRIVDPHRARSRLSRPPVPWCGGGRHRV